MIPQSFHADAGASCGTGGNAFNVGCMTTPRAHPSRLWRTRPAAAPVPDLAAGVGDRRPATGRHRSLRGVRPDDGGPQRRPQVRYLVSEFGGAGRPCRAATRRIGLGHRPHRRQLAGWLGGLRTGTPRTGPHRHRHRAGRRVDPLDAGQVRGGRQVRLGDAVLGCSLASWDPARCACPIPASCPRCRSAGPPMVSATNSWPPSSTTSRTAPPTSSCWPKRCCSPDYSSWRRPQFPPIWCCAERTGCSPRPDPTVTSRPSCRPVPGSPKSTASDTSRCSRHRPGLPK